MSGFFFVAAGTVGVRRFFFLRHLTAHLGRHTQHHRTVGDHCTLRIDPNRPERFYRKGMSNAVIMMLCGIGVIVLTVPVMMVPSGSSMATAGAFVRAARSNAGPTGLRSDGDKFS